MKPLLRVLRRIVLIASLCCLAHRAAPASAQTTGEIRIVELQGTVEISPRGATAWVLTQTNQVVQAFDRLRTGPSSRAVLRWSDQTVLPVGALSELEIRPPSASDAEPGLHLLRGILSFFHRDKPGRIRVITSGATAGIKGTEFVMEVAEVVGRERTTLSVIDGEVEFGNAQGTLTLTNLQQAVAEAGQAPLRTAGFIVNNLLQWCFYYPAVLDLKELPLTTGEQAALGESLAAYRQGELLAALANYPQARPVRSDAERVYHAALLLAVGQVEQCETQLASLGTVEPLERQQRLAGALRLLIAAVKREPRPSTLNAQIPTATELLAASYYEQSLAGPEALKAALELARRAVELSPEFGFGWERVAELEFSFGRTGRALVALDRSLALTPRNAQALGLKGFLLAAQNQTHAAIGWFDQALAVDGALGNAWLGRGLCRIRRGDLRGGREDLLVAAAVEPRRAALRSYLGKAWSETGDDAHAQKELTLARRLDPNDPTSWLYSALNHEQHNRLNEAIRDLEKSQELNHNRSVYRSGLLLDQDRAVRSANLARIYHEAGMEDVALREASRAVAADYGNYSAHLFLANSYELLRRQNSFDLRYETPAFSEYLIASLLGPADGRLLAQPVTQQEYTRLFERDRLGFSSSTEYLSRGAWNQYAAQYGTLHNSSYALEGNYLWDPGQHPNGGIETRQVSFKFKQMLTPRDGLLFQVQEFRKDSGDLSQRYDPSQSITGLRVREEQDPDLLVGLDHRWSETQHTLLLASRFNDRTRLNNPRGGTLLFTETSGVVDGFLPVDLTQQYENRQTINSFELQHLMQHGGLQTIAGIRLQEGTDRLANLQTINPGNAANFESYFGPAGSVIANQSLRVHSLRVSPYLYEYWQVAEPLLLVGGVSYDYQRQPRNLLFAPLDAGTEDRHQVSPKVALIWTPAAHSTVRAAYSRSLGGVDLDQSIRLEPTQLAGFVQAYRNVFPDSLVGGVGGATFETADVSLEQRFQTGTYVAVSGQYLRSWVDHEVGAFARDLFSGEGPARQTDEHLRYKEHSLDVSVRQLLSDSLTLGLRYRVSDARLTRTYPEVDPALRSGAAAASRGLLHRVSVNGLYHHPSGFFAGTEAQWWSQQLRDDLAGVPGDDFWQVNFMAGYRSPRRRVEITVGLWNATGQDYRLHPVNLYPELPRTRTLFTQLRLNF